MTSRAKRDSLPEAARRVSEAKQCRNRNPPLVIGHWSLVIGHWSFTRISDLKFQMSPFPPLPSSTSRETTDRGRVNSTGLRFERDHARGNTGDFAHSRTTA